MAAGIAIALLASPAVAASTLPRRTQIGASVSDQGGVQITFVRADGPAARAGLRAGDSVLAVGGSTVPSAADFISRMKVAASGTAVTLQIRRAGVVSELVVVPEAAPREQDPDVKTWYESIGVDGSMRRTIVSAPSGLSGRRPALLILGGIGCFSIDNATDKEDAYMRLTHDLARRGIISMRVEKSGVGDSRGAPCATVDLQSEMRSYAAALGQLPHEPHVDGKRIYLFGHSIGSLIAPRIASPKSVAGVIIAEGVGRNWIEYELLNLRRQLDLAGTPPEKIDAAIASKELCMHRLLVERMAETEIERAHPECAEHNAYPASASYMQQAAALNVAEPWTTFSRPLLAIYGTADFVTTQDDHRRIVDIVNAKHPGTAKLVLVDGMDHHLDVAGDPQQAYDLRVKEHRSGPYDENLSKVILDWLCERETCTAPAPSTPASQSSRNG